jgi:NAD(P)-dependent dehydrogenase (short-subunit alcohol dehydrogenase family)
MASRPVVLVTGAARRLGRAIALHLGEAGFNVAVHFRGSADDAEDTAHAVRRAGARADTFAADLSDEFACRTLLPAVAARMGQVDAVVNNASVFEYDTPDSFGHASMERHWRANVAPAVLLTQSLHAHVKERAAAGCVVNLVDQKLWNPNPDYFSYTLSKAALEAATVMLAQAFAPELRVCGVAPGVTVPSNSMTPNEFAQAHTLTPLARSSTPDDVARAVRYLLEAPAVTGTTLLVDGGQHLARQPRDVLFLANPDKTA